jgi:hypothetical protein
MLEKLKEFVVRLVKDEEFRTDLANQPSEEDQTKVLEELGYNFALADVEAGAIKILELAEQGLFNDLNEGELTAVFGGVTFTSGISSKPPGGAVAMYGVPVGSIDDPFPSSHPAPAPRPRPWWDHLRPLPHRPGNQAIYGAPVDRGFDNSL